MAAEEHLEHQVVLGKVLVDHVGLVIYGSAGSRCRRLLLILRLLWRGWRWRYARADG